MRRALLLVCLAVAASAATVARASTPPGPTTTTPTATVPVTTTTPAAPAPAPSLRAWVDLCQAGQLAAERVAVFSASMPAVRDASQMRMRFTLYARTSKLRPWRRLTVPKWGGWQRATDPAAQGFVYSKRVQGLIAPAYYRAVVEFRWLDDDDRLVRARTRATPSCRQPDLRPDLAVTKVTATPAGTGMASYTLTIVNRGAGPAAPFALTLAADRGDEQPFAVDPIAAGASRTVTVQAARCHDELAIVLDPDNALAEVHERHAPLVRPCPVS